ncbi:MAG TPA: ATP-binding protein [Polyangiaceae bacterium]|nr:ATP-binding protein [Polyangiaceae bacterium]
MQNRVMELEDELARMRAKGEALARELEEARHYRSAVEGAPLSILRVAGAKGCYVFINEAFARLVGHPRDGLMARDPFQVWVESAHPDDMEPERAQMARVAKGEIESFQLEKRVISLSGETHWVRMDAFASRDAQGRLEFLTIYFTDIEEQRELARARHRLEAQLREEKKLGAVGKLAGGIAHDFNNRLVVVMGYAELMKRELPADSPLAYHADMVLGSAKRAAELTRQLLAYSRRQVLEPEAFELNEMAERMRSLLKTVLADGIDLVTVLAAKRPVLADPGQIERVVLNLVLNARDAMPSGGKLTIETADVTLAHGQHPSLAPGEYVALVVADTGTGIAEDALPHIFEPFFTTKKVGQGTGLGLSMVEGIVHQSGGATCVESALGKGTTFTVYLPRAASAPIVRAAAEDLPSRSGNFETVLVCDDDDDVRNLIVEVLRLRAYSIITARSGEHALELARRHQGRIHLLVSDLAMPGLGGMDLGAQLRSRDPSLRVLYISGYSDGAERLPSPRDPGVHFLPKPFLPGDLTSAVSHILEGPSPSGGQATAE